MSDRFVSVRSIALTTALLLCGACIEVPVAARADDCLLAPSSTTPKGRHWYYHTDQTTNRKCWFLRVLPTAAQDASGTAAAPQTGAISKPAATSAGTLLPTRAGVTAPPLPPPRPQAAAKRGTTTSEPAQERLQEGSIAPSIPDAPAPQTGALSQRSAQTPAAAPAPATVWPDPPAVTTIEPQTPNSVRSDIPEHVRLTGGAQVLHDSEGAVQSNVLTILAPKMLDSPQGTLVGTLLVIALGLIAAGLLYRLVIKIGVMRDQQIIMDHAGLNWVEDQHKQETSLQGQQHGFFNKREEFIDDLQLSLVPAAGDYNVRRPLRARNERGASHITEELSERQNSLTQLIQDLDLLLSKKEAYRS